MSSNDDSHEQYTTPNEGAQSTRSAARIVLVVGSAWQALIQYPRLISNSICIAVDVAAELASLRVHPATRSSIYLFPSGRNSTIKSLAQEYGSPEQLRALESFPNMSLEDGIGQVRGFGAMAVRELIARADFQSFARQLPGMLLSAAGGEMPRILFDAYQGSAGGQAGEGTLLLWDELTKILRTENRYATIDSSIYLIGGISYTGKSFPRTQANASATVAEWLHRNKNLPGNKINLSLYFSELPPVGTNKPLRTQCLLDHYNALRAPAVQLNTQWMRSNRAAAGEYGNVLLTRSDQFRGISKSEVVGEVASNYLPKLEDALKVAADPGQLKELGFEYQHANTNRPTVKKALAQAMRTGDVEQLIEHVLAARDTRVVSQLALQDGGAIDLQRVRDHFAKPVRSLKDVKRRIAMLKGAIELVASETTDLRRQFDRIEPRLEDEVEEIEAKFARFLRKRSSKLAAILLEKLLHARQVHETLEEMHHELTVLRRAEEDLRTELRELVTRIDRLRKSVRSCATQSAERNGSAWIVPIPITRSLAELLAVADTNSDDSAAMHHTLSTMTYQVTLDGLARITGATSVTVESIVSEVIGRQHARKGPNWGGAAREDQADAFLVYPPVHAKLQERLIARHEELGHDTDRISFSQGADCSVNVSAMELRSCSELREILTPHYQAGLSQILASEAGSLFLSDLEILKDLGITGIDETGRAKSSSAK